MSDVASAPAPPPPQAPAPPPETSGAKAAKALLAVALLAVAVFLAQSRWTIATVDWYLGSLRQDPGDPDAHDAFRRLGDRAIPRIEEELASADANGRVVATFALAMIHSPSSERILSKLAQDADPMVAANAVAACGRRRDAGTAEAIGRGLQDERRPVRIAARFAAAERSRGLPWWAFGTKGGS